MLLSFHHQLGAVVALSLFMVGKLMAAPDLTAREFSFFVGHWDCAGHFIANGIVIESVITYSWDEETQTMIVHHGDLKPNRYRAVEIWGFPKAAREFRSSIGDAFNGIRWYTSPGFTGDTLAWTRSEEGRPIERFSYLRTGVGQMTVEWWTARRDGGLTLGDTLDCRRSQ